MSAFLIRAGSTDRLLFTLPIVCYFLFSAALSYANCAMPMTYDLEVNGSTVSICPVNFEGRLCPDSGGLLRENASTKEVVKLSQTCEVSSTDADFSGGSDCYIDECVDGGTYRYGFAVPYSCHSSSCGTYYYAEIEVKGSATNCVRVKGTQPPVVYTEGVPWKDNKLICSYGGAGGCSIFSSGPATVLIMNFFVFIIGFCLYLKRKKIS